MTGRGLRLFVALGGLATCVACSTSGSLHDRAASEDGRLLALVPTVAGARSVSDAPTKLLQQPPSEPSMVGLVTRARYWTVGRAAASVYAELTRVVPVGLKNVGSGSSGGPTLEDNEQFASDEPRSLPPGIAYAEVLLAVVPTGPASSAVGVYAEAVAQPSRPADEVVPSSASVTVVATSGQGVVTRMVALTGASASRLVRDFNLLSVSTDGEHGCPALDGSAIGATMRAGGHTWRATDIGCGGVSVTRDGKGLPGLDEGATFRRDLNHALGVPPVASVVHRLAAVVSGLERANGKAYSAQAAWAPDEATAVKTMTGDLVTGSSPVYVIQLQGRFTCTECHIPRGAKPPKGGVLVDMVNARTFRSEDFSLTNNLVSLSEVGPEFSIPIRANR